MTPRSSLSVADATVLIVDDTRPILDMYASILQHEGYRVHAAESGASALATLDHLTPDLIILDCMMPDMSGLEVLERVRASSRTQATPVVILTATGDDEEVIAKAFAIGANDYLHKPINRRIFCERVASLLQQARQLAAARSLDDREDEHARVVEELDRARTLQHSQLPSTPSVRDGWRVLGALRSCNEVGGDLFDIIDGPSGLRTLALVDVSGHGLSAAMVAGSVRGMLRLLLREHPIDAALHELNNQLCALASEHYACIGLVQFRGDAVHIVNAGLPPILLYDGAGLQSVAACGVPPGLLEDTSYEKVVFEVRSGVRLIGVTDGMTEPFGAADDSSRYLGSLELLSGAQFQSAAQLEQRIADLFASSSRRQPDDATLVVADRL